MGGSARNAWILPLFLAGLVQPGWSEEREKVDCYKSVKDTIYNYGAMTIDGDEYIPFERHVRPGGGFVPNFQLFQKGDVNGAKEQKVFTFLKNACPPVTEEFGNPNKLFWEPLRIHDIKWNFEKFLVGPDGVPVMRWYHRANIEVVKNDILAYFRQRQEQNPQEQQDK
ncbi:glutathione peroxidase 3 [Willisornis vidua]|uniref:glutathione peroxidase n=1 Tax=Willisornis vidua TaxID=1566151 RepID=A0ABQ9DNI8_9PASS|nr:glutathione peroxidase 3 [Willisornis vidua]